MTYLILASWVFQTIGKPYADFITKAEEQGFEVMEDDALLRAEALHAFKDIDDPNRRATKTGWFDWMAMDIEEYDEQKKREKEKSFIDSLPKRMRVPSKYSPGFWPMLCTGIAITLHCLLLLMQVWRTDFNCWLNYAEVDTEAHRNDKQTYVRISPLSSKDELLPCSILDGLGLTFEYNRRKFVWDDDRESWVKIRARCDMNTSFFRNWRPTATTSKRMCEFRPSPPRMSSFLAQFLTAWA